MQASIVFFGSSPFSTIVLEKLVLNAQCSISGVVTTPDKPAGRGLKPTPNPVKVFAQKNNLPVFEHIIPEKGTVGIVAAYGKIIKKDILDAFAGQIYNIHPSLLPKYRGASPLQQQILDGVEATGVTIIQMDELVDHGPIVAQEKDVIHPDDTWKTLGNRLFEIGADLFIKLLTSPSLTAQDASRRLELREGLGVSYEPQDHSIATFTRKLTRQDGFVPWEEFKDTLDANPAVQDRKMRAFQDWPGVWTVDPQGKRVKLVSLHPLLIQSDSQNPQPPSFPKTLQSTPKFP